MRTVKINDDFDLEKIAHSGQCFRAGETDNGWYRFIARDKMLLIRRIKCGEYEVSCSPEEWDDFWKPYFDLGRSYAKVRKRCKGKSDFVDQAMKFGRGLRVLNQDPWEMLITFIISQRKSIPAISKAVEELSARLGSPIADDAHAFPTPEQICAASDEELRACGLGYRVPYVRAAAEMVLSGELDLEACSTLNDEELFEELQRVHGVGKKVANCVCLFGFGRSQMVPVDVWIARAIEEDCEGDDPFEQFGPDAGLMQQYVFYLMTHRNKE